MEEGAGRAQRKAWMAQQERRHDGKRTRRWHTIRAGEGDMIWVVCHVWDLVELIWIGPDGRGQ